MTLCWGLSRGRKLKTLSAGSVPFHLLLDPRGHMKKILICEACERRVCIQAQIVFAGWYTCPFCREVSLRVYPSEENPAANHFVWVENYEFSSVPD